MNECKLVEDLLPLYAEDLVSQETGEFIREHSAHCQRCRTLLERSKEVVPMETQNNKDYKKALHRGIIKTSLKGAVIAILVVLLIAIPIAVAVAAGVAPYGETNLFESHDGIHSFQATYWGGIYGHLEGMVKQEMKSACGSGSGGNFPWRDFLDANWSPDGANLFLTVEMTNGETGMYLLYHRYTRDEEGKITSGEGGWLPHDFYTKEDGNYHNLTQELRDLCRELEDFSTGWETITFEFLSWKDDSEAVVLRFETDDGCEGTITYNVITGTIVSID